MKDTINKAISGLERASEYLPTDEAMAIVKSIEYIMDIFTLGITEEDYCGISDRLKSAKQLIEARAESEVKEVEENG